MTPTTGRPRPQLVILAIAAGVGLAIALAIAAGFWLLLYIDYYFTSYALVVAGLTIVLTALAILAGRVVRPAPGRFWRLAALPGIEVGAGLASSTCAIRADDTGAIRADDTGATLVALGLGAAALALIITAAVIKIAADRGVVRFYLLVGIAAYPVGWLTAFAWSEGFNPIRYTVGYTGIVFVMPAAALAGVRAWRQYRISPLQAVAVGCWAALAISLAALSFAWGFHANSHLCPIIGAPSPSQPCQSHLNVVVCTPIAGGVPPALAAGAAGLAGAVCQRRARPPP